MSEILMLISILGQIVVFVVCIVMFIRGALRDARVVIYLIHQNNRV